MEVSGTENAYDSGRCIGRSIRTASVWLIITICDTNSEMHTFVLVIYDGVLFNPGKFLPFALAFLVQ